VVRTLADSCSTSLRGCADSLKRTSFADHYGLYDYITVIQLFTVCLVLALPVCNGALEELVELVGSFLLGIFENIQSFVYLYASYVSAL